MPLHAPSRTERTRIYTVLAQHLDSLDEAEHLAEQIANILTTVECAQCGLITDLDGGDMVPQHAWHGLTYVCRDCLAHAETDQGEPSRWHLVEET